MNKILQVHVFDILISPEDASGILNTACRRSEPPLKVAGCCKNSDTLIISLEENSCNENLTYVFAPFTSAEKDDIIAGIKTRYYSGFSTICGFEIQDLAWGLFAFNPENRQKG